MPQWLIVALLTLAGTALIASGAIVGHLLSARAQKRAARIQAEATRATRENALIDQLQEELVDHRRAQEERMTAQETRMTALESRNDLLREQNDAYRDLLHKHRQHIYEQLPPPPPEWPADLPR